MVGILKYRLRKALLLLLALTGLISCSAPGKVAKQPSAAMYYNTADFIEAKKESLVGNTGNAVEGFKKVLNRDNKNHAACYELSRLIYRDNYEQAINYGEKAVQLKPDNRWYHQNMVQLYLYQKRYADAAKHARSLLDMEPRQIQHYYRLGNIYLKARDYEKAIAINKEIENKFGYDQELVLQRKQLYLQEGKYGKALKELDYLIEHEPDNKDYYGMKADIYMARKNYDEAIKNYRKILEINPDDGKVHMVLANYYSQTGNEKRAYAEMKKAFANPNTDIDSEIAVMMKLYKLSGNKQHTNLRARADTLLHLLLKSHPASAKALAMKGDFLVRDQRWPEALETYQKVLAIDSTKYLIWEQIILIEREMKNYRAMENYSRRALNIFPQYAILYYFNAKASFHLKKFKEADAALNLGLNFVYKDRQKVEYYTLLGMTRDSLGWHKEAGTSFIKALMAGPNDTEALKASALHLASYNDHKEEAVQQILQAVQKNPQDADMLATGARVMLLSNKNSSALEYIDKALRYAPENKAYQQLKKRIVQAINDKK